MATANHLLAMTEEPLTPNTDDIGARARTAVGWRALSQFCSQGISIVTGIILARLLMPSDFGIIGMAGIITGLAGVFQDLGFGQALVQRAELRPEHTHAAFWMTLIMGGLLYGALYLVAPWAAEYFHDERVAPVLRLTALSFLISPFGTVPRSLLQRELDFRKPFWAGLAGTITSGAVGITLALLGHSYWSLVWSMLASSVVGTVALCLVTRYTPPLVPTLRGARDLFSFGAGLTLTNIANYIATRVDYIVIGRRLDASALGLYTRAYGLIDYFSGLASSLVNPILFPAFSAMQTDRDRVESAYLRSLTVLSLVGFPLLALLVVSAPELIPLVYGEQWREAVVPTQVLCLMGACLVVGNPADPLLKGLGHINMLLALIAERAVVVTVGAWLGARYGVIGVAWGVAVGTLMHTSIFVLVMHCLVGVRFATLIQSLRGPALLAALILFGAAVGRYVAGLAGGTTTLVLIATVLCGTLLWVLGVRLCRLPEVNAAKTDMTVVAHRIGRPSFLRSRAHG